ncbi:metallophosphoesterase family protein [Sphingomonas sp. ASV193]|uniref:metallophosphoesterase family protein n=1 Tax=Sphingomonas sp. ASV193 TaxID=3144405 RepID=UPI0032E8D76A
MRVYAIGDIHGRSDLLDQLLSRIRDDLREAPPRRHALVFLGDYVDRGPDSAGVIERLVALSRDHKGQAVFLMGNHEEVVQRILAGEPRLFEDWMRFGGRECLASYGIAPESLSGMGRETRAALIREAIPEGHRRFLDELIDTVRIGDYLFVHAGIRPGIDLGDQVQSDLRWIRAPFLDDQDTDHGAVVVHGHTVTEAVEWRGNRIGIDTGAYASGRLTALVLEGRERRLIDTGRMAANVGTRLPESVLSAAVANHSRGY